MYTDIARNVIVISENENKKIKRNDAHVLAQFDECRRRLPNAPIEVEKKAKREIINDNYISSYIMEKEGRNSEHLKDYEAIKRNGNFQEAKNWFYEIYPEVKEQEELLKVIREKQKAARQEKREQKKIEAMKKKQESIERYLKVSGYSVKAEDQKTNILQPISIQENQNSEELGNVANSGL